MRHLFANWLHQIEQACVRARRRLRVRSCVGCACRWVTSIAASDDGRRKWRVHMMPSPLDIEMDCMDDPEDWA